MDEALETDAAVFPGTISTQHYARGLAYAAKGMVEEAEEEQRQFEKSIANPALVGRVMHNNPMVADGDSPSILKVSEAMLAGEIEYRKACVAEEAGEPNQSTCCAKHGLFTEAFALLRRAVDLSCNLKYDEPWGQMQPIRHALALGALLLEQGHVDEAMGVYREDAKLWRLNMWGLLGLKMCLEQKSRSFGTGATRDGAECQSIMRELNQVTQSFGEASKHADKVPSKTCFCATSTSKNESDVGDQPTKASPLECCGK